MQEVDRFKHRLIVDIGSTFTKILAFRYNDGRLIASETVPTTSDDVRQCLREGTTNLSDRAGLLGEAPAYVCSSAAGGLRIAIVGLVPALSLAAAEQAALGAGGKIAASFGRKLNDQDLVDMESLNIDLIILAGGTDGGDEETILHNANMFAAHKMNPAIVVAGNQSVAPQCARVLEDAGLSVTITENLLPEVDRARPDPVNYQIRRLFMEHIVSARGIDKITDVLDIQGPLLPTPAAMHSAVTAVAENAKPIGLPEELVLVDVGGATTDVYSAHEGQPKTPGAVWKGLKEPYIKRTVEGDLGLRANAATIVERAGRARLDQLCGELDVEPQLVDSFVHRVREQPAYIPRCSNERAVDAALARCAVEIAVNRHSGTLQNHFSATDTVAVQRGKDLRSTGLVIGSGGIFRGGPYRRLILAGATEPEVDTRAISLVPGDPRLVVDQDRALIAVGLASTSDEGFAQRILEHLELTDLGMS
jgi:uncharacterized protein (TIGR01319 family)